MGMFSKVDDVVHTTPPREANVGGLLNGAKGVKAASQADIQQAMLAELVRVSETNSEIAAHLRSGVVNDVLAVDLCTFDTTGVVEREYRTMVGSAHVINHGTANVTLTSAPRGASAPGSGKGAALIPPGGSAVIHIGSHTVTLYGTAGQQVTLQVFTKSQPPDAGLVSSAVTVSGSVAVTSSTTPVRPGTAVDTSASAAIGAAATATLAAVAARTTWITGFELTWDTTGTGTVNDTVTVTAGATVLTYKFATVAGAAGALVVKFPDPIPATAVNTAITVATGAPALRSAVTIDAHGFQL